MDKPQKADLTSMDVAEDKRRQLGQLFPEVVTETLTDDGKLVQAVDFERLKGVLGEFSEILENQRERYGMTWPGKNECLKIIQQPSIATLKPCREESVNFDETENLFIEGDNLEALKLLQKAYYGKVKMIYIDPPYNTGKEFIYPDNYSENLDTYLRYTGQVDAEGRKFSSNTEAEGRFHSKWLNMMLPRLYLARNLLRDDGVIFISIDDHEVKNLRELCDEVFGEESFVSTIVWEKRYSPQNAVKWFSDSHDFLLVYAKNKLNWYPKLLNRSEAMNNRYRNLDDDPRGVWKPADATAQGGHGTESQFYVLTAPNGKKHALPNGRCWVYTEPVFQKMVEDNRVWFGADGNNVPAIKRFLSEVKQGTACQTIWKYSDVGHNQEGKKEVNSLFPESSVFDTPKPVRLLNRILHVSTEPDSIILDFFSGSCTTAHAVLELNKQDGGNRKFIMVQLPEPCDEQSEAYKAGYKTIADIGKERIRRVIKKLEEEEPRIDANKRESKQEQLFSDPDIGVHSRSLAVQSPPGFKVFKLDRSNFRLWDGSQSGEDADKIATQLELHEQHIDPGATQEDILYELLLKAGFPLATKVEPLYLVDGKLQKEEPRIDTNQHESKQKDIGVHSCSFVVPSVFSIAEGALLICLQEEITKELIKAMADADPLQVICLDSGFKNNDQLKANAVQTFKARNKSAETATVFRTV